jgi:hypothetical protein
MSYVSTYNGLEFGKDVKLLSQGDSHAMNNYLEDNENKTMYGILFCEGYYVINGEKIPCKPESRNLGNFHMYTILYNLSNTPDASLFVSNQKEPHQTDPVLLKLKLDMDNAYLELYSRKNNKPVMNITTQIQAFPTTRFRFFSKGSVLSSQGCFYFYFPTMFTFVIILLEIMREKDLMQRKILIIIGLKNSSFWLSWIITSLVFSIIMPIILVLTGIILNFDIFRKTPFFITWFFFFLFSMAMQSFAYFLSTVLKSQKSAYTVKFNF